MDALIWLLVLIAAIAVVYWAVQQLSLPRPVQIVAMALLALVALALVAKVIMSVV